MNEDHPPPLPLTQPPTQQDDVAIFSELSQLCLTKDGHNLTWKETARWVKYEENVEENGTRWSKPYVSAVNLAAFIELKESFRNGVVLFDTPCDSLDQLVDEFCQLLRIRQLVSVEETNHIAQVLLSKKQHQFQAKKSLMRSLADMRQNSSNNFLKLLSRSSSKVNCSTINEGTASGGQTPINTRSLSTCDLDQHSDTSEDKSKNGSSSNLQHESQKDSNSVQEHYKFNTAFRKKLPENAMSNNILIGEVDFLSTPISGFIRLRNPSQLGNLAEVSIPTKFIFIYLGPKVIPSGVSYFHIGRAFATLMSDPIFRSVALKTQNIDSLLVATDEFLNEAPILPPNLWDPETRIEPPDKTPQSAGTRKPIKLQSLSKNASQHTVNTEPENEDQTVTSQSYYNHAFYLENDEKPLPNGNGTNNGGNSPNSYACYINDKITMDSEDEEEEERLKNGLVRSGRMFGGLINDIKRKAPHYISDFKDAFAMQSIASVVFLYFACLTPIITFGGLLGDATGNNIATMESLVCGALCGIIYGLFSGQPLTILGSTGPVLVFETIVFDFCQTYGFNYLSVRFWIGIWTATILMIFVAFDASYFVCYITRFTEENFASLISVIFMYKAIEKLVDINKNYPLELHPGESSLKNCNCRLPNSTLPESDFMACVKLGGERSPPGCHNYVPNVYLFSIILLLFTYVISVKLKNFNKTRFFTLQIRQMVADFAVPIAITVMTLIDNLTGIGTPKLEVPSDFKPTTNRTWLVLPFASENPIWVPFAALFPALLATILIFMDQQITAVIVNRKENKLKKGCGYHLDLFILSMLIAICSVFGLPWFVAATVLSITHVNSLKMLSQTAAPGDKPKFLGVREQRVTQVTIFILCGLSIFFTPLLQRIPMPVLYGVFLYMGVTSLHGSQFIDRILIVFMPQKYQPDYMFLRQVQTYRIHLFTFIQLVCFIFLWVVKSYKPISITFPLMLVVILGVRKLLDYVFTQQELKILDDKMPESKRKKKERAKARLSAAKELNLGLKKPL